MSVAKSSAYYRQKTFLPLEASVLSNESLTQQEHLLKLALTDGQSLGHKPLQFVMLGLYGMGEAPISITSAPSHDNTFKLCIRAAGQLTSQFQQLKPGATVAVRGPFGNGLSADTLIDRDLLFIAGGLGLAPLRSLINHVLAQRQHYGKVTILYGAKTPQDRLFINDLTNWSDNPQVAFHQIVDVADENWRGRVGVITKLFDVIDINPRTTTPIVCGPPVMYKFVIMKLLALGIAESRIYMSLERRMRCGLGRCGHCQINGRYVCQEGPVFTYMDSKRCQEAL